MIKNRQEYWSRNVPMTFADVPMSYEEKRRFRYELQDYMQRFFRFDELRDKLVLEIGSGAGIDSAEMLRNGATVLSVDFGVLSCKATKSLLQEARLDGEVIMADAAHLPFKRSALDVVYSYGVVHHIPEVDKVLMEVHRCLRDGGEFLGMVYNRDSLLYAYSILYLHGSKDGLLSSGYSEDQLSSRFSERSEGNPYTKCYTAHELQERLSGFFRDIRINPCYNVIDMPTMRKMKFTLDSSVGDELGWHLAFRAKR